MWWGIRCSRTIIRPCTTPPQSGQKRLGMRCWEQRNRKTHLTSFFFIEPRGSKFPPGRSLIGCWSAKKLPRVKRREIVVVCVTGVTGPGSAMHPSASRLRRHLCHSGRNARHIDPPRDSPFRFPKCVRTIELLPGLRSPHNRMEWSRSPSFSHIP